MKPPYVKVSEEVEVVEIGGTKFYVLPPTKEQLNNLENYNGETFHQLLARLIVEDILDRK